MTAFASQLQECFERHGGHKVSYSNNNDQEEFSWTWNAPDSINKIFPLCIKKLKPSGVFDAPVHKNPYLWATIKRWFQQLWYIHA